MKYKLDKQISFIFSNEKQEQHPYFFCHFFKTDDEAKDYAREAIEKEGIKDYKFLIEKIHENSPHIPYGMKLYEARIVKE